MAIVIAIALGSAGRAAAVGRAPIVRIGIAPEVERARITCDGAWKIGVVGGKGEIEEAPEGATWTFTASGDLLQARDGGGRDRGGGRDTLYLFTAHPSETPLRVDGNAYRGELMVFGAGGDRVTVVDVLDIESYLRGVLPEEIGTGGKDGYEALKAQAVAARSYTLAYVNRWRGRGFDLLSTVEDQQYGGISSERPETDRAVEETCGVVALSDGSPIEAYYGSTCGGVTAAPEEVWGLPPRPYLTVHLDSPGEGEMPFCASSPQSRWSETWTGDQLERILKQTLPAVTGAKNPERWGRLKDLVLRKRSKSTRVKELEIAFERKSMTVGGDRVRWILRRPTGQPLRSALILKIDLHRAKGRVAGVTMDGAGYGHGIGLCQVGALGMARAGYDYVAILRFYYQGAEIVRAYDHCPA